jgi:hypothetical protein
MTAVAGLLCCCDGTSGPCGDLPTALAMTWSGAAQCEWLPGLCSNRPYPLSLSQRTGAIDVSSYSSILTLNEQFCAYSLADCPPSFTQPTTVTSCPGNPFPFSETVDVTLRPCASMSYNANDQQWTITFNATGWGFQIPPPEPFTTLGTYSAKYKGPIGAPANDPRGSYFYDSGSFFPQDLVADPFPWVLAINEVYGSFTIS